MGVQNNNNNTNGNHQNETEHDTTHIRFREKVIPNESAYCFGCSEVYSVTSILDVIGHYSNTIHEGYFSNCLYCNGKVHKYRAKNTDSKNTIEYYHDCGRWRRQEDK